MNSNEPVAWAVIEADGTRISVHDNASHAAFVIEELAYDGMEAVPLYRSPLLTNAEREAIQTAMNAYGDNNDDRECAIIEATLWGLLERTK